MSPRPADTGHAAVRPAGRDVRTATPFREAGPGGSHRRAWRSEWSADRARGPPRGRGSRRAARPSRMQATAVDAGEAALDECRIGEDFEQIGDGRLDAFDGRLDQRAPHAFERFGAVLTVN